MATSATTKVVPAIVAASPAAPTQYVAVLVKANPKKPNSASFARFACYAQAGTVAAYRAAVLAKHGAAQAKICAADLLYDQRHAYISIHATAALATAAIPAPAK